MIYEKNCLFLFNKDLVPDFRGIEAKDVRDIKMFVKAGIDLDKFKEYINNAQMITYIDPEKRMISHLSGPKKGKVEAF